MKVVYYEGIKRELVVPSRLRFTRKTAALVRMFPLLDLRWEENVSRWKWNSPLFDCKTELLKMQKSGQFPDEPVRRKGSQIH
jgi:hypothetical protein